MEQQIEYTTQERALCARMIMVPLFPNNYPLKPQPDSAWAMGSSVKLRKDSDF